MPLPAPFNLRPPISQSHGDDTNFSQPAQHSIAMMAP